MLDDTPYVRLEHLTDPSWESIRKAAEKGIFFVMQPIFLYAEIESYLKNLGETWMKQCYPVRTILDQGVKLCFFYRRSRHILGGSIRPVSMFKGCCHKEGV